MRPANRRRLAAATALLCALAAAAPLRAAAAELTRHPCRPRQLHLHFVPGTSTALTLRWSADVPGCTPRLTYGRVNDDDDDDLGLTALVAPTPYPQTTYHSGDMCASPASDAAFAPPSLYGATLDGLTPGADHWLAFDWEEGGESAVGGANRRHTTAKHVFRVPPAPSRDARVSFAAMGDMGTPTHPRGKCPGAAAVAAAVAADVAARRADAVLHIGDVAYADGVPGQWDQYEREIEAAASVVPLAVAAGNHEAADGAGECCVPYAARYGDLATWRDALAAANAGESPVGPQREVLADRLPPTGNKHADPPAAQPPFWYSFDTGPVAVTVLSTEHAFARGSAQYEWAARRLLSIDRCVTPWNVVALHRPLYVPFPHKANRQFGAVLRAALEPLFLEAGVDAVLGAHVHIYSRSCPVAAKVCTGGGNPFHNNGTHAAHAPYDDDDDDIATSGGAVHWTLGTGGRKLSGVDGLHKQPHWVEAALAEWGFLRVDADGAASLAAEFVGAETGRVLDRVRLAGGGRQQCDGGVGVA